jgi:hypothetical protein
MFKNGQIDLIHTKKMNEVHKAKNNSNVILCNAQDFAQQWQGKNFPLVYVTSMSSRGARKQQQEQYFVSRAKAFIGEALAELKSRGTAPRHGRERYLLCLPTLGTGMGGGRRYADKILASLLFYLYDVAKTLDNVDFALVCLDKVTYQASLQVRRMIYQQSPGLVFSEQNLPQRVRDRARGLIAHAKNDNLVLFVGSGCSTAAGLPTWGALLRKLGATSGLSDEELTQLQRLHYLDQGCILQKRLGGAQALARAVATELKSNMYAMTHAFCQALPTNGIITLNYDTLLEESCKAAQHKIKVLPYDDLDIGAGNQKWLLKMHGCVNHPQDIVLTREHYNRYGERRQGLASIVQSELITKHALFIGFGFADPNFFKIASTVRTVRHDNAQATHRNDSGREDHNLQQPGLVEPRPQKKGIFGTSISRVGNPLMSELWENDVDVLNMVELNEIPGGKRTRQASTLASRRVEIFLDYVVWQSTSAVQFVLDPAYTQLLDPAERKLQFLLNQFVNQVLDYDKEGIHMRQTKAWGRIGSALADLGFSNRRHAELNHLLAEQEKDKSRKNHTSASTDHLESTLLYDVRRRASQVASKPGPTGRSTQFREQMKLAKKAAKKAKKKKKKKARAEAFHDEVKKSN